MKIRVMYNDKTTDIKSYELGYDISKPNIYTLITLQATFGQEEGLKYYNQQNVRYGIQKVEYEGL